MLLLKQALRMLRRDDSGAAIVEMAVVLPALFAVGLGVLEFSNLFYNYHLLANGVRDGARYAAGRPQGCCDDIVKNIAMTGEISGGTYRVSWWNDPSAETTVSYTTFTNVDDVGNPILRGGANIVTVTVSADVPYASLGFLGYFGLNEPKLHVSHEERLIGVR